MKKIRKIFMSGRHNTPSSKKEWSIPDVDKVLTETVAAGGMIPLVVGTDNIHPKDDYPTIGHIAASALVRLAEGDKVAIGVNESGITFSEAEVNKARKEGNDKVSVWITPQGRIKHLCLVSKAAVADLNSPDAAFSAGESSCDFAVFEADSVFGTDEWRMPIVSRLARNLREWILEKFGADVADKVLPSWDIDTLSSPPKDDGEQSCAAGYPAQFSANKNDPPMTEAEKQEMQQLKSENAAMKTKLSEQAKASRQSAIDAVFSAEEFKGKITDKNRERLQAYAESLLPLGDDGGATFSDGDERLRPLREHIGDLPVMIPEDGRVATFSTARDGNKEETDALRGKARRELVG